MKGKRLLAGFLSAMLILSAMTSPSYATEGVVEGSEVSSAAEIAFDKNAENSIESSAPDEGDSAGAVQDSENMNEEHMSVQEFTDGSEEVNVTVNAPEGAFGAGTSMEVSKADEAAIKAAAEAVNAEVSDVEAAEITFIADGVEVEPSVAVRVSMKYSRAVDADRIKVVHVDDDAKAEIITDADVNTEEQTVSFDADSFSVYAVVYAADTENGEDEIVPLDEKDNYVFQINYIFEDGTTAAQSYSGTFARGSGYSTTVKNPEVQGYAATAPTVIPEGVTVNFTADALEYSFTGISKDIILNVVYKPALVNYTVRYYQQNVDDDQYTLVDTVTKQGYTGAIVSETYENTKDKYEGFYGLRFETPAIAADGSTEVEIKYDRNYYMLSFDLGGGYGVEPVYARYGAAVEEVGTPVRAGYTFVGWDQNIPTTMPAQNLTVTANWSGQTVSYTVVYWYENADDDGYSPMSSSTQTAAIGTSDNSYAHRNDSFTGRDTQHFTYNSNLNENITVAADGSTVLNVYFTRNTYTFTFKNNRVDIYSVTAKYNSDISDIWSFTGSDGKTYPQTSPVTSWTPSGSSTYTVRITRMERMPGEDIIFSHTTSNNGTRYFNYYVESLSGTIGNKTYNNRQYDLYLNLPNDFQYMYYNDDFFLLEGFTRQAITQINNSRESNLNLSQGGYTSTNTGRTYNFYYTRNSYNLSFYNVTGNVAGRGGSVQYEAPLASYDFIPEMPDIYEVGSMEFAGWYLNAECTGERVDLTSRTMPAANLNLYAKWIPVNHNVNVYKIEGGEQIGTTQEVPHGSFAISPGTPTNGSYTFIGWFYKDANGVEKAFDFDSMPVRRDMEIYAKWGSNVLKDYTIRYVLEDGTVIADSTTGSALAGTTKTFEAKSGDALYAGYTEGYFPVENSHSLTIDIEDDTKNVYDFVYKPSETVPYQVKYVDADTGAEIAETKVVVDNRHSVVTETAVTVSGYLPDRYQKRLVISYSEDKENVTEANTLIFYYTKDDTHALVIDTHYILPLNSMDEARATEYQQNQETGTIGNSYTRNALTITNYVLDHVKVNDQEVTDDNIDSITRDLTAAGLVFEFYYRPVVFYVYHSSNNTTETVFMGEVKNGTYDITAKTASGYYYGGYYTKYNKEGTPYAGGTGSWTKKYAITEAPGTAMIPEAGKTYYLKEVPAAYLKPYLHIVYNEYRSNEIIGMYLMTGVDDANYQKIGLDVTNITLNTMKQVSKVTVQASAAQGETTITTQTAFGVKGFLGVWDQSEDLKEDYEFTYRPYFVTPDGVKVSGPVTRLVNTGDKHYYNTFDKSDDNAGIYRIDS